MWFIPGGCVWWSLVCVIRQNESMIGISLDGDMSQSVNHHHRHHHHRRKNCTSVYGNSNKYTVVATLGSHSISTIRVYICCILWGVHFFRDVMVQNQNISGIPLYQLIKWIQTSKYQRFWIIKVRRYTTSDSYVSLDSLKICECRSDRTVRLWTEWKIPLGWSKDPGVILLSRLAVVRVFLRPMRRIMMMIPRGDLVPGSSSTQ